MGLVAGILDPEIAGENFRDLGLETRVPPRFAFGRPLPTTKSSADTPP